MTSKPRIVLHLLIFDKLPTSITIQHIGDSVNLEKRTFIKMNFEDRNLEAKFFIYYSKQGAKIFKISILLGLATLMLYSIVDLWSLPITHSYAFSMRLKIGAPIISAILLTSLIKSFYKYVDYAVFVIGVTVTLVIALIIKNSQISESGHDMYYAGILLVNVWVATFVRAKYKTALFTILVNNLIYIFIALVYQDFLHSPDPLRINILYSNLSFLFSVNLVTILSCRSVEVYARNEFLQNIILKIDKHKLQENEFRLKQQQGKLVEASRLAALGEMAAGIAHEINNPLSIIVASSHQLKKKIASEKSEIEGFKSGIEKIEIASDRINKIVKSLKTFSRDGSSDEFQIESLSHIINSTIYYIHEKFLHSGINFIVNEIPNIEVSCKITQISQVLVNLLNNAYDAVAGIESPTIEISFRKTSEYITIYILDNGSGIDKEIADKIMRPFYTTKPVGLGTGLGLSVSQEIVEQHGGKLNFIPQTKGSMFEFSLKIKN